MLATQNQNQNRSARYAEPVGPLDRAKTDSAPLIRLDCLPETSNQVDFRRHLASRSAQVLADQTREDPSLSLPWRGDFSELAQP